MCVHVNCHLTRQGAIDLVRTQFFLTPLPHMYNNKVYNYGLTLPLPRLRRTKSMAPQDKLEALACPLIREYNVHLVRETLQWDQDIKNEQQLWNFFLLLHQNQFER